ncbi:carbon monoxide dehydrogenase [Verticiella sediminum]|uniref:Carbon monoxide dehydrogenase n=1 Tax=Verticiella sediminum TaxID=1247510 RepID=A0A556AKH4_9BURK|nr:FAD binding domain-containing protein [Verticiella sediminum]TSH93381.1 carbon monoxide dehydrogenase [Verticiella sediminum]
MKLPYFDYRRARTLDEAVALMAALGSDAKALAGGQSLLATMRYRLARPEVLLDLNRIDELRALPEAGPDGSVRLGAMCTHAMLAGLASSSPLAALLAAHAAEIAFPAVRTRGTVGGSLVHADPAADWPLLLCALGAEVELRSHRGVRRLPVQDFLLGPLESDLAIDELLTHIHIPARTAALRAWGRGKLMHRAGEFASSAAVVLRDADGAWACWLGAVPPKPVALTQSAALLDGGMAPASPELFDCASAEIRQLCPDAGRADVHRHAVNLIRAAIAAQETVDV